jgi:ribosomal protein L21
MTVVLEFGSKQYTLEDGQKFIVDRLLDKSEGEVFEVPVVYAYGSHKDGLSTIAVTVVNNQRGEKIRVTKYRPKSNYHRQYGPRQEETVLMVGGVAKAVTKAKAVVTDEVKKAVKVAKPKAVKAKAEPKAKKVVAKKVVKAKK